MQPIEVHTDNGIKVIDGNSTIQDLLDITGDWEKACALFELMVMPIEEWETEQ